MPILTDVAQLGEGPARNPNRARDPYCRAAGPRSTLPSDKIARMDTLIEYLPLILPLVVIQLVLLTFALLDLRKREKTRGPKWVWVLIILFVNLAGPIIYFLAGREEE